MTQRVLGPTGSPRRHWTVLLSLVAALAFGLLYIAGASAQLNRSLFELDKDATNDLTYTKIGVLNAAVSPAADNSITSITICQASGTLENGATVLIDGERLSLAGGANAGGGG